MPIRKAVVGDAAAEAQAIQMLAVALAESANWFASASPQTVDSRALSLLCRSASHSVSLATLNAPDPPLEVLALAARNCLELLVRLKHVLTSKANMMAWLREGVTDKLQVYEGVLSLDRDGAASATIREEMQRVSADMASKGLATGQSVAKTAALANAVGMGEEYKAFFKIYSKLVHPTSYAVNSATSSQTAGWVRTTFVLNVQLYGLLFLDELAAGAGLPASSLFDAAERKYRQLLHAKPRRAVP